MISPDLLERALLYVQKPTERTDEIVDSWREFTKEHAADIAYYVGHADRAIALSVLMALPESCNAAVFLELSSKLKLAYLQQLSEGDRIGLLRRLSIDDLTDFFEDLSDEDLKGYLRLLHKKDRETIIQKLRFVPDTAGSLMHTNVITLMEDFTVERSIYILQKLQPNRALHEQIFVTTQTGALAGYILLSDLVLRQPKTRISSLIRPLIIMLSPDEKGNDIVSKMQHYSIMIAPVVDAEDHFLGIITSDTLLEIIQQAASDDLYRFSAISPIKNNYFATSFSTLLYQRGGILMILLLLQSASSFILQAYSVTLNGFFEFFVTMLISTGGNASSQTSALAIQGIATGDIDSSNQWRFVTREFYMSLALGGLLALTSFLRTVFFYNNIVGSFTVSLALWTIICFSIVLGSVMPVLLKRIGIDPAHAAGPILTTMIDVSGLFIYCNIVSWVFSS